MTDLCARTFYGVGMGLLLFMGGCSDDSSAPEPPGSVSIIGPTSPLDESSPLAKQFTILQIPVVSTQTDVTLTLDGTATLGSDFSISSTSVSIPPGQTSATVTVTPFRDFESEGDESLTLTVSNATGNTVLSDRITAETLIVDGPTDEEVKGEVMDEGLPGLSVILIEGPIEPNTVVVQLIVAGSGFDESPASELTVEMTDSGQFESDTVVLERRMIRPLSLFDHPEFVILPIPTNELPSGDYLIRAKVPDLPDEDEIGRADNEAFIGFSVDDMGGVVTTCREPQRTAAMSGSDPLLDQTWHLRNTGQTSYADEGGVPGEDMRMDRALTNGPNGAGVEVVVHDTGLQICHPDLKASAMRGTSYNFNAHLFFGASEEDPYLPFITGDHGTNVSGIIAATAENGLGSRGVAPAVNLRMYNFAFDLLDDSGIPGGTASSLGASTENPNSSTGHIFNMSYGTIAQGENPHPDLVSLYKFGTSSLREGKGAIYVRAAGNGFVACDMDHPMQEDIGCLSSNADPEQNLPYFINVGAFDADGKHAFYASVGANLWVTAPGGSGGMEKPGIITTDQFGVFAGSTLVSTVLGEPDSFPGNADGDYTSQFGGTSASAPATTGAIALLLETNPDLTWRDVKHILASTARPLDPDIEPYVAYFDGKPYTARLPWVTNGAGYQFHNSFGFGAVSIDAAITMASQYNADSLGTLVATEWYVSDTSQDMASMIPDKSSDGLTKTMAISGLPSNADMEAVVLAISMTHRSLQDIAVHLISPAGTESILNPAMNSAFSFTSELEAWQILSNAFYGENPNGEWTLKVYDVVGKDVGELTQWELQFYYGNHP